MENEGVHVACSSDIRWWWCGSGSCICQVAPLCLGRAGASVVVVKMWEHTRKPDWEVPGETPQCEQFIPQPHFLSADIAISAPGDSRDPKHSAGLVRAAQSLLHGPKLLILEKTRTCTVWLMESWKDCSESDTLDLWHLFFNVFIGKELSSLNERHKTTPPSAAVFLSRCFSSLVKDKTFLYGYWKINCQDEPFHLNANFGIVTRTYWNASCLTITNDEAIKIRWFFFYET